jgi:HEPN domain-containing protein
MTQETKEWYEMAVLDLGVAVRYPNELFLEERHAKEALQYADELLQWVKSIIEQ